jgi:hypothetical protein
LNAAALQATLNFSPTPIRRKIMLAIAFQLIIEQITIPLYQAQNLLILLPLFLKGLVHITVPIQVAKGLAITIFSFFNIEST